MNVKIETALNSTNEIIEKSSVDAPTKIFYQNLIASAAEGTNGLDEKAKLQSVSETCFYLTELFVKRDIVNHDRFVGIEKKLDGLSAKIDLIAAKLDETKTKPKSRLEIIMGSLQNIQWWWAAAFTAVVGILAYHDTILDVLNRLLM